MPSIGPQLPPHPSKRKRDDNEADADATGPQLPPPKTARRVGATTNDDEIALDWGDDDSDDDDAGPAAPPPKTAAPPTAAARPNAPAPGPRRPSPAPGPRAAIGPSMPPPQASTNDDEIELEDDNSSDDDSTGPAAQPVRLPPPAAPAAASRPVMGPAPPPAALSERPSEDPASDSDDGYGPRREEGQDGSDGSDDDDDDDDYGPAPADSKAARRNQERHHVSERDTPAAVRLIREEHDAAGVTKSKRDEWMVVPPPPTGPGDGAADPTKIRARGFATGRAAANSSAHPSSGLGSMWTETALQRAERVLSRAVAADSADNPGGSGSGRRHHQQGEDEEARKTAIRVYTEQTRGKSMYEEHQAALKEGKKPGSKKEEEDDPSKRAFDREKDMAVGGRITHAQRRDLMKQAADFGGRFQKGKYL